MDRSDGVDALLRHYGVKGMKWGVRSAGSSGPQDVKVKSNFGNRLVRTSGGKGHKLSEDATKAAVSRQKAKKSNVRSLSNKELQELVTRMNLEQQYNQLNKKSNQQRVDRGKAIYSNLLTAGRVAIDIAKQIK